MNYDGKNYSKIIGGYYLGESIKTTPISQDYYGIHQLTNSQVLIKRIKSDNSNLELEPIQNEINVLRSLRHPNISHLFETIQTHKHLYLIYELNERGSLAKFIKERGRLKEEEIKILFSQLISTICFLHKNNISHRNINIYSLQINKTEKLLKLTDFCLSEKSSEELSLLKFVCGTELFLAPEILRGESYSGMLSDIWSCGIILYYINYGILPFESIEEILSKKDIFSKLREPKADLNDLIIKILAYDPMERINLFDIFDHEWLRDIKSDKANMLNNQINDEILIELENQFGLGKDLIKKNLDDNEINSITSLYYLTSKCKENLLHKKSLEIKVCSNDSELSSDSCEDQEDVKLKQIYKRTKENLIQYYNSLKLSNNLDYLKDVKYDSLIGLLDATILHKEKNNESINDEIYNKNFIVNYLSINSEIDLKNESELNKSFDINHNFINCEICKNLSNYKLTKKFYPEVLKTQIEVTNTTELEICSIIIDCIFLLEPLDYPLKRESVEKILKEIKELMPLECKLAENIRNLDALNNDVMINKVIELFNERYNVYFKGNGINIKENQKYIQKIKEIGERNNFKVNREFLKIHNDLSMSLNEEAEKCGKKRYSDIHRAKKYKNFNKPIVLKKASNLILDKEKKDQSFSKQYNTPSPMKSFIVSSDKFFLNNKGSLDLTERLNKKESINNSIDIRSQASLLLSAREVNKLFKIGNSSILLPNKKKSIFFKKNSLAETFMNNSKNNFLMSLKNPDVTSIDEFNTSTKLFKYKREFNVSNLSERALVKFHSVERNTSYSRLNSTIEIDENIQKKISEIQKLDTFAYEEDNITKTIIDRTNIDLSKPFHRGCCTFSQSPEVAENNRTKILNMTLAHDINTFPKKTGRICSKVRGILEIKTYEGPIDVTCCFNINGESLIRNICYSLFELKIDYIQRTLYEFVCQYRLDKIKFNMTIFSISSEEMMFYTKFKRNFGNKAIYLDLIKKLINRIKKFE